MASAPSIYGVPERVRDAIELRGAAMVAVVTPGSSGPSLADRIAGELTTSGRSVAMARGSRGATASRWAVEPDDVLVVSEAQWLADDEIERLATDPPTAVVLIHRPHPIGATVAAMHAEAHRDRALFEVGPTTGTELVEQEAIDADDAEAAIAATGGQPDLLESWLLDGSLERDVSIRLSLVDDDARLMAELVSLGATVGDVGALTNSAPDVHDRALAALRLEGLLAGDSMPPAVADAVRSIAPPGRRARAIELLVQRPAPGSEVALADALAALGDRSAAAGDVHLAAARHLVGIDDDRATSHLDRAAATGTPSASTAPVAAAIALSRGEPAEALRHLGDLDQVGDDEALVAARAWYALGDLAAAASVLEQADATALAVWARVGAALFTPGSSDGQLPDAAGAATGAAGGDPVSAALATAVLAWVSGERDRTLASAGQMVVRAQAASSEAWPATPHAVASTLAARLGDVDVAARWADQAVVERPGGPAHRRSDVLLSAWWAARQGRLDDASSALEGLAEEPLSPRERWWHAAVRCTIALRDPQPAELESAAADAADALARLVVDLYDLELLGETAAVHGRLRAGSIDGVLGGYEALLDRVGRPPHLVAEAAVVRLLAALSADDEDAWAAAAQRVVDLPPTDSHPAVDVAIDVAHALLACAEGELDDEKAIVDVADALAGTGRVHEAARICGIAAVRVRDETTARALLKRSRDWRLRRAQLKETTGVDRTVVQLSQQEERVARLVDEGHTYKQIGAELYISPKTVEHHVAHIRSKLGASSRAELLAAIRAYVGAPDS